MSADARPIYLRVADRLERAYARKAPGTPIPSENELARAHDVSRLTARAALEELERRHLVTRSRGRGTFVARRIDYSIGADVPPSFSATVRRAGAVPRIATERIRLRVPPEPVRRALALAPAAPAYFVARRRYVDGIAASYAESWVAPDLAPALDDTLGANASLHEVFAERYALEPVRSTTRVEFVIVPARVARRLGLDARPLVAQLEGVTASQRFERPIQLTHSWLRADVFRIVLEVGRP
ncbi:MAG TPA: GntR family transcriptional regulator [Candidatus Elarobacter sp.]|nr:GntR family transcriptional regulator [Candidatus Elarobacter sp.]